MPRLALSPTGGYYADPNRHWSAQDCVNYLPMKAERAGTRTPDQLRQCPGLRPFAPNLGGALRGLHNVEGKLFAVGGSSLYRIKADVVIPYGTVPGTARVSMAHNAANELLTVNGSAGYLFNTASLTLDKITDEGYPGASVVGFVDQYFPQVAPNGAYWFWSDLSNGAAYNTLDRAEAEADPDRIVTLFVSHREVLIFGRDTIEPFINTGAATGTFQRAANTVIECGCAARFSVAGMDNAVFFLDDKRVVRVLRGVTPERVSTAGIEQALGECTAEEISRAFAFTWEDRGHKVYYLTVPGRFTFGFDLLSGEWHRRLSPGLNTWRITSLVFWEGQWIGGDAEGKLYALDWDYHYDGQDELIRERVTGVLAADQRPVTVNEAELLFSVGGPASELDEWPEQPEAPTIIGSPPDGVVGDDYSYTFTATGGTPPYTFVHHAGTLPPDTEQATDGELAGPLTTAGTYADNMWRVYDANGLWDDVTHTIVVSELTPTLITDSDGFDGTPDALIAGVAFDAPSGDGQPVIRRTPDGLYAAFSRRGDVSADRFGVRKWNTVTLEWDDLADPANMPSAGPYDMAWSNDGLYLACGVFDTAPNNFILYRRTGDTLAKVTQSTQIPNNGYFVAWSADDSMLAVGNGDSAAGIYVYDVAAGVLSNGRSANTAVGGMRPTFNPTGTHLAAGSVAEGLFVLSISAGALTIVDSDITQDAQSAGGVFWNADGIVTVSNQGSIGDDIVNTWTFAASTLTLAANAAVQPDDACRDSAITTDGRYLAVACEDGNVYVYDLDDIADPTLVETEAVADVASLAWGTT